MRASVLCIGVATLDIVNRVAEYPAEDSEVRALGHTERMGGNAANTAIVLAQLGLRTAWVGNLAPTTPLIDTTFAGFGVAAAHAVRVSGAVLPTSYILLSDASGSRSIVHHRDMPEYPATAFSTLPLDTFDWLHFEGRAVDQLEIMLQHARAHSSATISLEIEKPRAGIEKLFGLADLLMFSHDYACARGFTSAADLLTDLGTGTRASCTWGAQGAWAIDDNGSLMHTAAPRLMEIVDSVGAGDVFNAAMIHALSDGKPIDTALRGAVELATAQCTLDGLILPD